MKQEFSYVRPTRPSITEEDTETYKGFVKLLASSDGKWDEKNHEKWKQKEPLYFEGDETVLNSEANVLKCLDYLHATVAKDGMGMFFNVGYDLRSIFKPWFLTHTYSHCKGCKIDTKGTFRCSQCGASNDLKGDDEWRRFRQGIPRDEIKSEYDLETTEEEDTQLDEEEIKERIDRRVIYVPRNEKTGFKIQYRGRKGFTMWTYQISKKGKIANSHPKYFFDLSPFFSDENGAISLEDALQKFMGTGKLREADRERLGSDLTYWQDNLKLIIDYCKRDAGGYAKHGEAKLSDILVDTMSEIIHRLTGQKGLYVKWFFSPASVSKAFLELCYPQLKNSLYRYTLKDNLALARALKGGLPIVRMMGRIHHASSVDEISTYPSSLVKQSDISKQELKIEKRFNPKSTQLSVYDVRTPFNGFMQYFSEEEGHEYPISQKPLLQILTRQEIDYLLAKKVPVKFVECYQFYGDNNPLLDKVALLAQWKQEEKNAADEAKKAGNKDEARKHEILAWFYKLTANAVWGSLSEHNHSIGKFTNFAMGAFAPAGCRVQLWKMIERVGDRNVIFTATDNVTFIDKGQLDLNNAALFPTKESRKKNPLSGFGKWEIKFRDTDVVVYQHGIYLVLVDPAKVKPDDRYCECQAYVESCDDFHRSRGESTEWHRTEGNCHEEFGDEYCICSTNCNQGCAGHKIFNKDCPKCTTDGGCKCSVPEWYPDNPPRGMEDWRPCYCLHKIRKRGFKVLTAKFISKLEGVEVEIPNYKPYSEFEAYSADNMNYINEWQNRPIKFSVLPATKRASISAVDALTFQNLWLHFIPLYPKETNTDPDKPNQKKLKKMLRQKISNHFKMDKVRKRNQWKRSHPQEYAEWILKKIESANSEGLENDVKRFTEIYNKWIKSTYARDLRLEALPLVEAL